MTFVYNRLLSVHGLHTPPMLLLNDGFFGAVLSAILAIGAGVAGGLIAGGRDGARFLLPMSLGLAIWAYFGGTVDDYLIYENEAPGPATGKPFVMLLFEWAWVVALFAVVAWVGGYVHRTLTPNGKQTRLGPSFAIDCPAQNRNAGILCLMTVTVVMVALTAVFTGPAVGPTLRGQVYFAIAASAYVGALIAHQVAPARDTIWYWPAPVFAGLIGLIWAMLRPGLTGEYANINIIPPNGLARALPVEFVSVGVSMLLLTLPSGEHEHPRSPA